MDAVLPHDRTWLRFALAALVLAIGLALVLQWRSHPSASIAALTAAGLIGIGTSAALNFKQHWALCRSAETESLQRIVINSSPNAVVASDSNGRILTLNPAAERMFARPASKAVGVRMSDLIGPSAFGETDVGELEGNILERLGERMMVDARRGDGTLFPVEMSVLRVGTGRQTLFAAYIRDLTEQRMAVAANVEHQERIHQSEKLSAMGSLLAGVAHELNNPLAILVTQATLLREKAPTPDVERRAERIYAAAQRAGRIVKSFIAMARQKAPVMAPTQINAVVDASLELVGYGLRSAGVVVERRLDPELPLVDADRDLLGQVFANLILNAQQALLDKVDDRQIRVATTYSGRTVTVEVADNGPGVPDAIAGRIFEPYFTTKPVGAGTGIGLSICKSVVAAHEGTIDMVPSPGGGAVFRVCLPIGEGAGQTVPAAAANGKGHALSILIVDDETDVADSLAELITLFGHRTTVLSSAAEALGRIRQQAFDAVFTDLRMPGMNGIALRHAIRAVDERLARRTVIMTGDTVMGPQHSGGVPAASDGLVLDKPFTGDDVRAVLDQIRAL